MDVNIALAGNPNVGKTSLYNRITHSLEHVGNWHGVTVSEVSKSILYDHNNIKITDLPGFYSLTVYSFEEEISRDKVLKGDNDVIISICDVNNLSRNLYLTLQLLELDLPVILVVNMMDELKKQGKSLNHRKIERILKIPVVPMSAKYHSDVHLLMDIAIDYVKSYRGNKVRLSYLDKLPIKQVVSVIGPNAEAAGLKPRYAAVKYLERDAFVIEKLKLSADQEGNLKKIGDMQAKVAQYRYEFIDMITDGVISSVIGEHHEMHEHLKHNVPIEDNGDLLPGDDDRHVRHHNEYKMGAQPHLQSFGKLDKIVLNKYLALPIFLLIMVLIFFVTFGFVGSFLSDLLGTGIQKFIHDPLTGFLSGKAAPAWLVALVGDGIINGVGGVLVFLPQIVLLFFFLALLEDSGYISRVAFMTDGLFRRIGLSGRSVFTMLMGFGCSATAVLTARGLEDDMMRKKTVLLTPFMSCSARLPVYTTIASAFFLTGKPFIIFGMYVLGAVIAVLSAFIFEKTKKLKSGKLSFIMEMPPYRVPTFERVVQILWNNAKVFIVKVGTIVFALNVIVWLLSNFSFTAGFITPGSDSRSILEIVSNFIAPVFAPLGFGNWKAVTALLSGLVAKEVVIASITSLGGVEAVFVGEYAALSALCFMVFTLLYVPCVATITAMRKEIGLKWTIAGFFFQIGVAYVVSLLFRLVGLLFIKFTSVAITVAVCLLVGALVAAALVKFIKTRGRCCNCSGCGKDCGHRK